MPDHKYIKRERKNGKWRCWYEEPGSPGKLPEKPAKPSAEPVLTKKPGFVNKPITAYKLEDGRTVYAPSKATKPKKSIATKTMSEVKKELDAKKSAEPYVSDEYKKELEYNSKKNSFTNEKSSDKKITESTKKKVEPISSDVSDEYKQELEYNSKKNDQSITYKEYDAQYQQNELDKMLKNNSRPYVLKFEDVDRNDEDSVRAYLDFKSDRAKDGGASYDKYASELTELWNDEQTREFVLNECMDKIDTVAKKATSAKEHVTDTMNSMIDASKDSLYRNIKRSDLSDEEFENLVDCASYAKEMTRTYDEIFWKYNKSGNFNMSESDKALMDTCLTNATHGLLDYISYCEVLKKQYKGKNFIDKFLKSLAGK